MLEYLFSNSLFISVLFSPAINYVWKYYEKHLDSLPKHVATRYQVKVKVKVDGLVIGHQPDEWLRGFSGTEMLTLNQDGTPTSFINHTRTEFEIHLLAKNL